MAKLLRKRWSCWPLMPKIEAPFVEQRMSSIIERNMWGEKEKRAAKGSKEWWELSELMILLFRECVNGYTFFISNNIDYYVICWTILNIVCVRSTSNGYWSWTPCDPRQYILDDWMFTVQKTQFERLHVFTRRTSSVIFMSVETQKETRRANCKPMIF